MAAPEAERSASGAEFSPARSADEDELDDERSLSPDVLLASPEWRCRFSRGLTRIRGRRTKCEDVGWFNGGGGKGGVAGRMHG